MYQSHTLKLDWHSSLYPHKMLHQWLKFTNKAHKVFWIFSKHLTIIIFIPTADTLNVRACRTYCEGKESFYVHFNSIINYQILKNVKQKGWNLHNRTVYISTHNKLCLIHDFLFLYRAQSTVTTYGNATNWNSTGYWEESYQPPRKYREMCLTNNMSPG
jgi:hypothetical protein